MTSAERPGSPEETIPETKVEPEPVFIDEVLRFLSAHALTNLNDPSVQTAVFVVQGKMDRTLALLQNADPADPAPESPELIQLEGINFNATVNPVSLSVTAALSLSYSIVFYFHI